MIGDGTLSVWLDEIRKINETLSSLKPKTKKDMISIHEIKQSLKKISKRMRGEL